MGQIPLQEQIEEFMSREKYRREIEKLVQLYPKKRSIIVDFKDLDRFDPEISDKLITQPEEVLKIFDDVALKNASAIAFGKEISLRVRVKNLPETYRPLIRDINSTHIGKYIEIEGVVTKVAEAKPKITVGYFECKRCGRAHIVQQEGEKLVEPVICECGNRTFKLNQDRSEFIDVQRVQIQEPLEKVKGGVEAHNIDYIIEDDFINVVKPGDKIVVAGILKLREPKGKTPMYNKYLHAYHIDKVQIEFEEVELDPEDIKKIEELSKDPKIIDKITHSIAPSIYGHDQVKLALALQLFGGTENKLLPDGRTIRSDIHVLLIGDPGVAKSEMLRFVDSLAPKSVFVSGKSVSGAGLTATAEKDDFGEGGWTLKAGALVLASGGIACLDEFDKIDKNERMALHEVMEQQNISVAKAGIVTRFKAKTSILAAANPKYGRFDPNLLPTEQFDIPPSLISRFDLIFPIRDVLDTTKDKELAEHILEAHRIASSHERVSPEEYEKMKERVIPPIDKELMRKYISYARKTKSPVLTSEAMDRIREFYVDLRTKGKESGAVPITPRQIEGIIRLSEACAKARLSDNVELSDADVAIGLVKYVMKEIMYDKESGRFDVDIVATGRPKSMIEKARTIIEIIRELEGEFDTVDEEMILGEAKEKGLEEHETKKILNDLKNNGDVYQPRPGTWKTVS